MKGRTIALDTLGEGEAAALIVDGQLQDLLVDSDHPRPGTIYRAVALRPVKGQGGMFLTTPDGNAFLRQVKGLAPGDRLLVQVTGFAEPGKAIPVTTRLLFKSRYAIVTPEAPGLNVSRSIRDEDERDRLLEIAQLRQGLGLAEVPADVRGVLGDGVLAVADARRVGAQHQPAGSAISVVLGLLRGAGDRLGVELDRILVLVL